MRLPNWFKVLWWISLLTGLGVFLATRYNDLMGGKSTGSEVLVLVVWLVLVLLPLFQEISLFGLTFKREFEALKTNVKEEVAAIRSEIRNSVDIRTQINPNFVFPVTPPDSRLPAIEKSIEATLERLSLKLDVSGAAVSAEILEVPSDAELLFRARYNIERELRRIWQEHLQEAPERRFLPTLRVAHSLVEWELIPPEIERAIREVWTVASPAIHGESVTQAKVAFVRDVAPKLVATLRAIN